MLYERLKTETANQRHQKFDVKRSNLYLFSKMFRTTNNSRQIQYHQSIHRIIANNFLNSSIPSLKLKLKKQIKYIHPETANQRHQKLDMKTSNLYLFPKHFEQQATQAERSTISITPEFLELEYPLTQT